MEGVAGIEEDYIFPFGHSQPLVHRIIQPVVALTENAEILSGHFACHVNSGISRRPVDYDMLEISKRLPRHRLHSGWQLSGGVECDCNYRYEWLLSHDADKTLNWWGRDAKIIKKM